VDFVYILNLILFKEFLNVASEEQEGQHPLTGQRAPPISGGT